MVTLQAVGIVLACGLAIWATVIGSWKLGVRYWSSR
jgi:hypothetical protein